MHGSRLPRLARLGAGALLLVLTAATLPLDAGALPIPQPVTPIDAGNGCLDTRAAVTASLVDALPVAWWDYGDAPDDTHVPTMPTWYVPFGNPVGHFPTLAGTVNTIYPGQPGARHEIVDIGWLGNRAAYPGLGSFPLAGADLPPTLEKDADLAPDQDGAVVNLQGGTPDHDGRDDSLYPGIAPTAGTGTLTFRVSSTTGITKWYVNALLDQNFDGDWAFDPGEWIVVNMPVSVPALTSSSFTSPPFATGPMGGTPWLRITLSQTPITLPGPGWDGSTPPGTFDFNGAKAWKCGETEDYCGQQDYFIVPRQPGQESVWCDMRDVRG